MKPKSALRSFLLLACSTLLAAPLAHAQSTYIWASSNVNATGSATLDWFTGGSNAQGAWTGGDPVSANTNTIKFLDDNATALTNTAAVTQTSNVNNGGSAFQLGVLTLTGKASATATANLAMIVSGDALNFSDVTGTINLNAVNNTRTITYNINSNIQLGTASSADALTITGNGTGTFNIGGLISELQTGGGSLIKSGSSIVNLSNTGNSYSGGTTLSGGVLQIAGDGSLGATSGNILFSGSAAIQSGVLALTLSSGRTITMNSGATAIFQAQHVNNTGKQFNFAGKITGDGGIQAYDDYTLGQYNVYLTGTTNDFKGSIGLGNLTTSGGVVNLHLASLVDDATHNGNIIFGLVGTAPVFDYTGSTALTLDNRRVELASTKGGVLQNTGAGVMTVNTNLLVSGTGNQTFTLGGTNTGANTFSGDITSVSGKLITLAKAGTGKWNVSGDISGGGGVSMAGGSASTLILSGTNTYSGATTTPTSVGGTLIFQGLQALSSNTAITQNQVSTGGTQMRLLDDSSASSTVNFTLNTVNGSGIGNSGNTIFVGNNGTANGGSNASSTATNETISIGKLTMINNATSGGSNWAGWGSIQGANGYRLLINSVDLPSTNNVTTGTVAAYFVPTTASVTLAGTIKQLNGNNKGNQLTLQLDGTNSANFVTGNILDAADFTDSSNATAKALNVTKSSTSTWTLSGTNAYTGATAVQAGTLLITGDSSAATGAVAVNGTSTLGGNGATGGTVTVAAGAHIAPGVGVGTLTIGGDLNVSAMAGGAGTLKYDLGTNTATSDKIAVTGTLTIGAGTLGYTNFVFTDAGGLQNGTYTLITATGGITGGNSLDGADLSGPIGVGGTGTLQINGSSIELVVSGLGGGPGPLDHFAISAISSPQTVGTAITGITLTAQDASNATVTSFTGTVTFGGSGGFTGISGTFTAGMLSGVGVTPTVAGSNLTFTVDDGASHTGSTTITTIQSQYDAWAGGAAFDADSNGDGVKNGVAFLLGASGPNASVTLPVVSQSSGNLILTFNCLNAASRGSATLGVQHSSDLGITDPWTTVTVTDTNSGPTSGVTFTVTPGSPTNSVTATISSSEAASGKLFGRLNAVITP